MKTLPRPGLLLLVVTCAAFASALRGAEPTAIDVPFTRQFAAADLTVERVTARLAGDDVEFNVRYTSERARFLSVFDPPDGDIVKAVAREAIQPGAGVAQVRAPAAKLRAAVSLAMRLSEPGWGNRDGNFLMLQIDAPELRPIFGERLGLAAHRPAGRGGSVTSFEAYADIRWKDASALSGLDAEKIRGLRFNEATRWNDGDAPVARAILEAGKNPGLGVRALHRAGITGAGVAVGIIDQNLLPDHPEFNDQLARYHDVGCHASGGSMHGPAVASLLVGKTIGTAPGARLYFVAAPSWNRDAKDQAAALHWLLDLNAGLPAAEKLRVISVSAAPSGIGSPFDRNNALWDEACARAAQEGVLVLDCTRHRGAIGVCYGDPAAPDDLARVAPGFPGSSYRPQPGLVLAPSSRRTVAEEYNAGDCAYQYTGVGGLSWSIPYAAGVLALGWQVNPGLSGEQMLTLLRETAHEKDGARIIDPAAFIAAVKRTTLNPPSS